METLAAQIRRLIATNPEMTQQSIARTVGVSPGYVSMVKNGERGQADEIPETAEEGAALLALEKTKQALRAQEPDNAPKDNNAHAEAAFKNAKTWATLAGKATNRERDRDEEMSDEEAERMAAKFLRKAGKEVAQEAEALANQ